MYSNNPFTQAVLSPNFALGHLIQWKLDPVFKENEPYEFSIEISGTPDFSEIIYTLPSASQYHAVDDTNFRQANLTDMYYRVKLVTDERNTYYSNSMFFGSNLEERRPYRIATEIVRKELLRLRRYCGITGYLLKRKSFGEIRTDAVDPISGVPITDNVTDFGTGIDGGYFQPLRILYSYESGGNDNRGLSPEGFGTIEQVNVRMRMIGHPMVETHDIIVDTLGDSRFIVRNVGPTTFPGTCIVMIQNIEATQIPVTDPVYKIELPHG